MSERPVKEGTKVAFQGNIWTVDVVKEQTFVLGRDHRGAQLVVEVPKADVAKLFRHKEPL